MQFDQLPWQPSGTLSDPELLLRTDSEITQNEKRYRFRAIAFDKTVADTALKSLPEAQGDLALFKQLCGGKLREVKLRDRDYVVLAISELIP